MRHGFDQHYSHQPEVATDRLKFGLAELRCPLSIKCTMDSEDGIRKSEFKLFR